MNQTNRIGFFFIFLFLIGTIVFSFKPQYDWDLVAYVALAKGINQENYKQVHQETFESLQSELDESTFENLVAKNNYRKEVYKNPDAFLEQIPYYQKRILFIKCIKLFQNFGFPDAFSVLLVSLISVFAMIILVFHFFSKKINPAYAGVVALIIFTLPPITDLARMALPDSLSTLFLVAIAIVYLKNRVNYLLITLMLASVLTRTENVIFCGFLLLIDWFFRFKIVNFPKLNVVGLFTLFAVYLFLYKTTTINSWSTVFYNTLIERQNFPLSTVGIISLKNYVQVLLNASFELLPWVISFLFGSYLILRQERALFVKKYELPIILTVSISLSFAIKFLLFPVSWWRFHIATLIVIFIAIVEVLHNQNKLNNIV